MSPANIHVSWDNNCSVFQLQLLTFGIFVDPFLSLIYERPRVQKNNIKIKIHGYASAHFDCTIDQQLHKGP